VVQDGPAHATAAGLGGGVHRLELRVRGVEFLDRPDAEHRAVAAAVAEERDARLDQRVDVEREAVLRRRLGQAERQVPLEQRLNVGLAGVINGDLADGSHQRIVVSAAHVACLAAWPSGAAVS
jgi:hypothetical protein